MVCSGKNTSDKMEKMSYAFESTVFFNPAYQITRITQKELYVY